MFSGEVSGLGAIYLHIRYIDSVDAPINNIRVLGQGGRARLGVKGRPLGRPVAPGYKEE